MGKTREKKEGAGEGGAPAWMVTYGDMMGLLLCFFVLLLSFSTISEEAFNQAMMSLQGALGVFERFDSVVGFAVRSKKQAAQESLARAARELQRQLQVQNKDLGVKIEFDEEGGLKISLPNKVLFESASAELRPDSYAILDELGAVLRDVPDAFIEVRGHTDARPLTGNPKYRDNYDLSYARSDVVARRLNAFGRIPLEQFEITACGSSQPVATNATDDGQQANRRVEVYVRGAFNRDKIEALRERTNALLGQQATEAVSSPEAPPNAM